MLLLQLYLLLPGAAVTAYGLHVLITVLELVFYVLFCIFLSASVSFSVPVQSTACKDSSLK